MIQSGLILLNKKPGVTSFEALGEIKRALGTGKVGHTGTLDKFASGLLVVLVGSALKLTPWFTHCDKQYTGRIHFGVETDTLDPEGSIIAEAEIPSREKVEQALSQFTGDIMQAPPAYSAIHINGKRASELARSGNTPEMKKRPVSIYKIELRSYDPPFADIFVHCSSGTYIRSLARDIALAAGSRAHLCALERTQVAGFTIDMTGEFTSSSERPAQAKAFAHYSPCQPSLGATPCKITHPHGLTPCYNGRSISIDKQVITALGLPWYEIEPSDAEKLLHGKPLAPVLEGKSLFSQKEGSTETPRDFSAAVFSGETLVAVVERSGDKWKYGCVY